MRGLFVNQVKNQCSIYESGVMIFNALKSDKFNVDYLEMPIEIMNNYDYSGYDFYVFNWHHNTLPISSSTIRKIKGLKMGVVLEVDIVDIKPFMPEDIFDAYMVIDPTKKKEGKFYPFPRPLEEGINLKPLLSESVPVLGTFGFLAPGKNFLEVVENANSIGDCIVRINFPVGAFTGIGLDKLKEFSNFLYSKKSNNVDLRITFDYMDKQELISWCSEHSLNIFPYYRSMPGLSATTDQAIVSGRGLAITACNTFRHIRKYISYYPKHDYLKLTTSSIPGIKQMQLDWSNENFTKKFEELLSERLE